MWLTKEESSDTGVPEKYLDDEMKLKMIGLLETKVRILEREIKKLDPDLAKELGLS